MCQVLWLHAVLKMKRTFDYDTHRTFHVLFMRVYLSMLFVGVFFKAYQSLVVLSLYLLGF